MSIFCYSPLSACSNDKYYVSTSKAEKSNTDLLFWKTDWVILHPLHLKIPSCEIWKQMVAQFKMYKEKYLAYTLKNCCIYNESWAFQSCRKHGQSFVLLLKRIRVALLLCRGTLPKTLFKSPLQQLSSAQSLTLYFRQCQGKAIQEKRRKGGFCVEWLMNVFKVKWTCLHCPLHFPKLVSLFWSQMQ